MLSQNQSELCCQAAPECSICFESISCTTMYITKCQHTFHSSCINKWCQTNNSCPLCRTSHLIDMYDGCDSVSYSQDSIYNNNDINNIINNIIINNINNDINNIINNDINLNDINLININLNNINLNNEN